MAWERARVGPCNRTRGADEQRNRSHSFRPRLKYFARGTSQRTPRGDESGRGGASFDSKGAGPVRRQCEPRGRGAWYQSQRALPPAAEVRFVLIRGQKSEVRGQKSEVRSQKSEVRSQRSEVRG